MKERVVWYVWYRNYLRSKNPMLCVEWDTPAVFSYLDKQFDKEEHKEFIQMMFLKDVFVREIKPKSD